MKKKLYTNSLPFNTLLLINIYKTHKLCVSCMVFFFLSLYHVKAQDNTENYKAFATHLHLKNMHIWHGFIVHPGPMIASTLAYHSRNKKVTLGVWGGASFGSGPVGQDTNGNNITGFYKELSMYAVYQLSDKLYIEAVSHNNYTGVTERGEKLNYFGYERTQRYNFIDCNVGYQISKNLSLYFATILFGQSQDYEVKEDGSIENNWTHYLEAKAKILKKETYQITGTIAGAFSLVTEKTFYTKEKANFINIAIAISKNVTLGTYIIPVEVTAMWNPESKQAVLQADLKLF